jgi:hypothetical protein
LRLGIVGGELGVPLDPNDRQYDDRGGFVARLGASEPDDTPLIGEFDYGAHQPLPLTADTNLPDPQ